MITLINTLFNSTAVYWTVSALIQTVSTPDGTCSYLCYVLSNGRGQFVRSIFTDCTATGQFLP